MLKQYWSLIKAEWKFIFDYWWVYAIIIGFLLVAFIAIKLSDRRHK